MPTETTSQLHEIARRIREFGVYSELHPGDTPLADILGVTRQVAVSAFQFGDGLSNLVWPTSSTVFAYLAMANLPYDKYLKVIWKLFAILTLLGFVFVIVGQMMGYA